MPRNRPRVSGSWRDTDKGECWTKTNASGATFVVCEGSKGQKGVYKGKTGGKKQKKEATKIQKVVRGRQARKIKPKEVEFSDLKRRKGTKTEPRDLYMKVVDKFGSTQAGSKKGEFKVKNIPSKEGTGSQNTQKFNLYMSGDSGTQFQFNPYTPQGKKALEEGKVKFVRRPKK